MNLKRITLLSTALLCLSSTAVFGTAFLVERQARHDSCLLRGGAGDEVLELACRYLGSFPRSTPQQQLDNGQTDFLSGFSEGLAGDHSSAATASERDGFLAGQAYRSSEPGKARAAMSGLGYRPLDIEGQFSVNESGSYADGWLLRYASDPFTSEHIPAGCSFVRIRGYIATSCTALDKYGASRCVLVSQIRCLRANNVVLLDQDPAG